MTVGLVHDVRKTLRFEILPGNRLGSIHAVPRMPNDSAGQPPAKLADCTGLLLVRAHGRIRPQLKRDLGPVSNKLKLKR